MVTILVTMPDFDEFLFSDPCPVCGTCVMLKSGESKEEATKEFLARHTKEACDHDVKMNEWVDKLDTTPCPECGETGGGFYCDCLWENDESAVPSEEEQLQVWKGITPDEESKLN